MSKNEAWFSDDDDLLLGVRQAGSHWADVPEIPGYEELVELRYMWAISSSLMFEPRIRRRKELEQLVDAAQKRTQYDFFIRLTWRFTIFEN